MHFPRPRPTEFQGELSVFFVQSTRYIVDFFFFFYFYFYFFSFFSRDLSESLDIMKRQLRSDRSSEFDWLN